MSIIFNPIECIFEFERASQSSSGVIAVQTPKLIQTFNTTFDTLEDDLLRVDGDNSVIKIDSNNFTEIPNGIFGIGYNKPSTGTIDVLFVGINDGYIGLTPGLPVFVGEDGAPSHSVPGSGMVQQIGFAISSNEIFFNLMQAIRKS